MRGSIITSSCSLTTAILRELMRASDKATVKFLISSPIRMVSPIPGVYISVVMDFVALHDSNNESVASELACTTT